MALNNKKNLNITGLKATFFDLFRDHTADVVKMIESLASGQTEDVVNVETSIFQRIIMLNKTANSIDSLEKNVETLSALKANDTSTKNNSVVGENVSSNQIVPSDSKVVATPVNSSSVGSVSPSPEVAVTPASVSSPSQPTGQVISGPIQNTLDTSTVVKEIPSQNLVPKEDVVQSKDEAKSPEVSISNEQSSPPTSTSVVESEKKGPIQFVKQSDKKTKAILVNAKQFGKLMASRQSQFGLLRFGAHSTEDVSSKIESLMKKASSLYKEGKVSEAQAMYAEISALNKQLNQGQGRDKVLMKRAA